MKNIYSNIYSFSWSEEISFIKALAYVKFESERYEITEIKMNLIING